MSIVNLQPQALQLGWVYWLHEFFYNVLFSTGCCNIKLRENRCPECGNAGNSHIWGYAEMCVIINGEAQNLLFWKGHLEKLLGLLPGELLPVTLEDIIIDSLPPTYHLHYKDKSPSSHSFGGLIHYLFGHTYSMKTQLLSGGPFTNMV